MSEMESGHCGGGNDRSGLPLRDAGVPCENCGSEKRRRNSNRCAGCGQFAPDPRYAYSNLTDTWYIVHDWEDRGEGKIVAKSKEEVPAEKVPQEWKDATDTRPLRPDTDQEGE